MPNFDSVQDTLFVPMLGRIYASEHFPHILSDAKALELKPKLPTNLKGATTQTQYTLMASACRSANMDRYISEFLHRCPDGVVVELGCGLETTFYRNQSLGAVFVETDLPEVIEYRSELLPAPENCRYIPGDAFAGEWLAAVRAEFPEAPILVTASGLFYYFEEEAVLSLMRMMSGRGHVELVFDTVNKSGANQMAKKYMKQVGHEDAKTFFYVNDAQDLAAKINGAVTLLAEEKYYAHTPMEGLSLATKLTMRGSDLLRMVKMVHLRFE